MKFSLWLMEKYKEWSGGQKSINQFAKYLEISQATINSWLNETRSAPKAEVLIRKLADKLGPEIYPVLNLEPPSVPLVYQILGDLPPVIHDVIEQYTVAAADRQLTPDSPAAEELIEQILAQHGFHRTKPKQE